MLTAPERQLALNCARQMMAPDLISQTQEILQTHLRWDQILQAAWQNGIASLLYKNLRRVDRPGAVPHEVMRKLLQLYHRTGYMNFHMLNALGELLERFASAGVKVIILKGAYLAQRIYSDVGSRPFFDLDLLVQKKDIDKAQAVLVETGYTFPPDLLSARFYQQYHFNLPFLKQDTVTTHVELHWNLTDQFRGFTLDIEGLWARACPAQLSNHDALVLSPEDLVSHLSIHLDMHGYLNRVLVGRSNEAAIIFHPFSENRLIWFTDLYEVIGQYRGSIDWAALLQRSRQAGTEASVSTTLSLLNVLFGPVVDSRVLEGLGSRRATGVKRKLLEWLISTSLESGERDVSPRTFIRSKLLAKGKRAQFRLIRLVDLWDYLLPAPDLVRRRAKVASRGLLAVFYVIHVVQAFTHCARSGVQLLFHLSKRKAAGSPSRSP